jgi:hypothetical protein
LARPCSAPSVTYVMLPWPEPVAFCRQHINHDFLRETRDVHLRCTRYFLCNIPSRFMAYELMTCTTFVALQKYIRHISLPFTIFCWIFRNVNTRNIREGSHPSHWPT